MPHHFPPSISSSPVFTLLLPLLPVCLRVERQMLPPFALRHHAKNTLLSANISSGELPAELVAWLAMAALRALNHHHHLLLLILLILLPMSSATRWELGVQTSAVVDVGGGRGVRLCVCVCGVGGHPPFKQPEGNTTPYAQTFSLLPFKDCMQVMHYACGQGVMWAPTHTVVRARSLFHL